MEISELNKLKIEEIIILTENNTVRKKSAKNKYFLISINFKQIRFS